MLSFLQVGSLRLTYFSASWRRSKFPELESLVHHAIDYARVVKAIGNEMDITLINLDDILPQVRPLAAPALGMCNCRKFCYGQVPGKSPWVLQCDGSR